MPCSRAISASNPRSSAERVRRRSCSAGAAKAAMERSAELRGLLAEIAREHGINRALMRQELAFLSHLTRLIGQDTEPGYRPDGQTARTGGAGAAPQLHRTLDLQA